MKTGSWTEGKIVVRIDSSIGAMIVKLIDRWIAVTIDNRIELHRWTVLTVRTDRRDQIDRTDQTGRIDPTGPVTTSSGRKAMQIKERGQASLRRAPVPIHTFSGEACRTSGTRSSKYFSRQPALPDKIGA